MSGKAASPIGSDLALMRARLPGLFVHDARGRLLTVNEPNGKQAPRLFLGRTREGCTWRLRADVDDALARRLERVCASEASSDPLPALPAGADAYRALLSEADPVEREWAGPVYRFPETLPDAPAAVSLAADGGAALASDFPDWVGDVRSWQPFVVLPAEGRIVSLCCSVRATGDVHEAGVETLPGFRGRGYAALVTAAWAREVRRMGAVPVYSTSWQNESSQAVAKRLALIQFAVDFHLT